jgi:hypothetical protein
MADKRCQSRRMWKRPTVAAQHAPFPLTPAVGLVDEVAERALQFQGFGGESTEPCGVPDGRLLFVDVFTPMLPKPCPCG